jgi:hypothetical protein
MLVDFAATGQKIPGREGFLGFMTMFQDADA